MELVLTFFALLVFMITTALLFELFRRNLLLFLEEKVKLEGYGLHVTIPITSFLIALLLLWIISAVAVFA